MPRYQGDHRLARALLSAPYPLPLVYLQGDADGPRLRPQVTIVPIYASPPLPLPAAPAEAPWKIVPVRHAQVDESTPLDLRPKKPFSSSGRMVVEDPPFPALGHAMGRGKSGNETDLMSGIEDAPCIELQKAREIGRWSNETRRQPGGEGGANVLTAAFEATMSRSFLDLAPSPTDAGGPVPPRPPPAGTSMPPDFPLLVKKEPSPIPTPASTLSLQPLYPTPETSIALSRTTASRESTPSPPRNTESEGEGEADSEDSEDTWIAPAPPPRVRPVPRGHAGAPGTARSGSMMLHSHLNHGAPRSYVHPSRRLAPGESGFASESSVATVRRVPLSKRLRPTRRWEVIEEEEVFYRAPGSLHREHRDHRARRMKIHAARPGRANAEVSISSNAIKVKSETITHAKPAVNDGFRNVEDLTRPKRRPSTPSAGSKSSDHSGGRRRKKARQSSLTPVPEAQPSRPSVMTLPKPLVKAEPLSPPRSHPPLVPPELARSRTASPPPTARQSHFTRPRSPIRRYSDIPMPTSSTSSGRFPISQLNHQHPEAPTEREYAYSETDRAYSPMSIDPISGRPLLSTSWPHPLPAREIFHTPVTAPPAPPPWTYPYAPSGEGGWYEYDSPMYPDPAWSSNSSGRRNTALVSMATGTGFGKHVHSIMLASRRRSEDQKRRKEERRRLSAPGSSSGPTLWTQNSPVVQEQVGETKPPRKRRRYWSSSDEDVDVDELHARVGMGRDTNLRGTNGGTVGLLPPAQIHQW